MLVRMKREYHYANNFSDCRNSNSSGGGGGSFREVFTAMRRAATNSTYGEREKEREYAQVVTVTSS